MNDFKIRADIQLKVIERNCCNFIETDLGNTIEGAFGIMEMIFDSRGGPSILKIHTWALYFKQTPLITFRIQTHPRR